MGDIDNTNPFSTEVLNAMGRVAEHFGLEPEEIIERRTLHGSMLYSLLADIAIAAALHDDNDGQA